MKATRAGSESGRFRFLAAELVVVFLGVYGAFLLEGCRERAETEERRGQILNMLSQDFSAAVANVQGALERFDQTFGGFLSQYEAGDQPPLLPIPLPTFEGVDTWGPVLGSGGLDLLDVELIRSIEATLSQAAQASALATDYNAYVREVLVPATDQDRSAFYQQDGSMRSKFLWYPISLTAARQNLNRLLDATREVDRELREAAH